MGECGKKEKGGKNNNMCNTVYGMGFIGALIYFMQHAGSFWAVLTGIFKAMLWPAYLIYKMLEMLQM